MSSALGLEDPVAARAVEWMVLLRSGTASAGDVSDFERWRHADPRHDAACGRIERVLGSFSSCSADPAARKALLKPVSRRRAIGGLLGLAGAGLLTGVAVQQELPRVMLADQRTGTGRRERVELDGGGSLLLNARTAIEFPPQNGGGTLLRLLAGEVMVRGAPGGFVVHTALGEVSGRDAEFAVRLGSQSLRVAVLRGTASLHPRDGEAHTLRSGEVASMERHASTVLAGRAASAETAWVDGLLQVNDRPLGEVVAALRDYRPGVIRIDDAAAALRISGVFPLDDTERSLRAIAQAMPVRVSMTTAWWVSIQAV